MICHIYYPELASEIRHCLDHLPLPSDLFFSTDAAKKEEAITTAFSDWPSGKVEIRIFPNRGRDIAPRLVGFGSIFSDYDLLLFIHSKKSLYFEEGRGWRQWMFDALMGSSETVHSILWAFDSHPTLGVVLPQHYPPVRDRVEWGGNFDTARELAQRMGVVLSPEGLVDFASGSMFWARPSALAPLTGLKLAFEDFPPELNQMDSTVAHAIERLILFSAEAAGFSWLKVTSDKPGESGVVVRPTSAEAVKRLIAEHRNLLTSSHLAAATHHGSR